MKPEARSDGLLVQDIGEELVVYDQRSQRAHRLNATAARVFRRCDGATSIEELATLTGDETLVWLALERLQEANLLRERIVTRKAVLVAALARLAPVVETLAAPAPVAAYTF